MSGRVVLGPCPCRGCGEMVWYGRPKGWLVARFWAGRDGKPHRCQR